MFFAISDYFRGGNIVPSKLASQRFIRALVLVLTLSVACMPNAQARLGDRGSMGSRGSNTFSAPPATQTAPRPAAPIERSITQPTNPQRPSFGAPPGARIETVLQPNIGACLYRRALLETLGGFDESYFFADDLDLLLRVRDSSTPFAVLEAVMLYHRRYEGSLLTQPDRRKTQEFARAVAASYRRRRAAGLPSAATFFAAGHVPS